MTQNGFHITSKAFAMDTNALSLKITLPQLFTIMVWFWKVCPGPCVLLAEDSFIHYIMHLYCNYSLWQQSSRVFFKGRSLLHNSLMGKMGNFKHSFSSIKSTTERMTPCNLTYILKLGLIYFFFKSDIFLYVILVLSCNFSLPSKLQEDFISKGLYHFFVTWIVKSLCLLQMNFGIFLSWIISGDLAPIFS